MRTRETLQADINHLRADYTIAEPGDRPHSARRFNAGMDRRAEILEVIGNLEAMQADALIADRIYMIEANVTWLEIPGAMRAWRGFAMNPATGEITCWAMVVIDYGPTQGGYTEHYRQLEGPNDAFKFDYGHEWRRIVDAQGRKFVHVRATGAQIEKSQCKMRVS